MPGEGNTVGVPSQQPGSDLRLEALDHAGQARCGHVQAGGRPSEVQFPREADEGAQHQQVEIHCSHGDAIIAIARSI